MIPYTIIKEVNPDEVKGSATGGINFLTFGVTALIGPIFADLRKRIRETQNHVTHFRQSGLFWLASIVLAIVLSAFLRETGHGRKARRLARHEADLPSVRVPLSSGVTSGTSQRANPDSSANDTNLAAEIKSLREALSQTQKQMAAQQREIQALKAQSKNAVIGAGSGELPTRGNGDAGISASPVPEPTAASADAIIQQPSNQQLQSQGKSEPVPLGSFRIGDAILELGGFVDLENIFRTTNTQSNIATNLGGYPIQQHTTRKRQRISYYGSILPPELQDSGQFCRQPHHRLRRRRLQRQRSPASTKA